MTVNSKTSKRIGNGTALAKERPSSLHIPYARHIDSNTVATHDGVLVQVIKLQGFSHETADQQQINRLQEKRNSLLHGMASDNYALWTTMIRRKETRFPAGVFPEGFAKDLNEAYHEKIMGNHIKASHTH